MSGLNAEAVAYRARALAQAHPLSKLARKYVDWAVADQRTSQPLPEIGIWAGSALLEGYCVRRVEEEDLGLPGGSQGEDPALRELAQKEEIPSDWSFVHEHGAGDGHDHDHEHDDGHEHAGHDHAEGHDHADHDHAAESDPDDPDGPSITVEQLDEKATAIAAELRSEPDPNATSSWRHADPADEDRLIATLNRIVASQVSNRLSHWRDSIDDTAWQELEEYLTWWVVKGYAVRVAEVELGVVPQ